MRRYKAYKNCNIPWIKQIPSHWMTKRAKFLYKKEQRPVREEDSVVTCFRDGVVTLRKNRRTTGFTEAISEFGYQGIRKGDLVIHVMDAFAGAIGVSDSDGKGTPVYNVCTAYGDSNNYYYAYALREMARAGFIQSLYRGIRERSSDFRFDVFERQYLPVPPREEQDQIVRYLDWQVSKINRLIAVKKRQLSILAEYRKAKIDEIILHGDKQAPQKDSGIWWLRDIPQSWQLIPLKRICQVNASISNTAKQLSDEELVTFLPMESVSTTGTVDYSEKRRLGDVRSGYSSFALDDVVIAKITPCFENGKGACLDSMDTDIGYGTTEFINLRASDRILPRYLYMITMTQPFRKLGEEMMTGSAGQKRVPIEFVKGFAVGIPPIEEQARLLALLNDVTKRIDCQTKSYYESIISLQELRTRLISDVVTGQVDVRGIKVPDDEYINNEITEEEFEEESENNEEE